MGNFVQGVYILFGALIFALIIEFAGGIIIDNTYNGLFDAGMYDDIPVEWQSGDMTNMAINLFHVAAFAIAGCGILAFFLIAFREESADEVQHYRY